jgi:hypothetical protein
MEGIILFQDKLIDDLKRMKSDMEEMKKDYDKKILILYKRTKELDRSKLDLKVGVSNLMSGDGIKYEAFILNQLYERLLKLEDKCNNIEITSCEV